MTISSAPVVPSTAATFNDDADAFVKWLSMATQEAARAFTNYGLLAAGSNSSLTIDAGEKTIVINSDSAFAKGHYVRVFDILSESENWMAGFVTDYNPGTKTLTIEVDQAKGSGTKSAWVVELTSYLMPYTENYIYVHTGNGHGSTNNKIRRFANIAVETGSAVTRADSASSGASFAINENGIYTMTYGDSYSGGANNYGISVNSSQLTTAIQSITIADILTRKSSTAATNGIACKSMRPLLAGDVIRAHTDGLCNSAAGDTSYFTIRKVR